MFFSIRDLEVKKKQFAVAVPSGEIEFADQRLRQMTPVVAEGQAELLTGTEGEIRVRGHLAVQMEADCDRCLEPARYPLELKFDLYYRSVEEAADHHSGEEVKIAEDEAEIAYHDGAGLELNDVLREQIVLALPMQHLCDEDCQGICPVCGENRNQADCQCAVKPVDDRWLALKKITN